MIFLTKTEIEEGVKSLSSILDIIVDVENGDLIADHMNELSSLQSSASLLQASAKYYYLKDKKDAEMNAMHIYCENLNKSLHYKISSLQSILRRETQVQYVNNRNI